MKKLLFLLSLIVVLLIACKKDEPINNKIESMAFDSETYQVNEKESLSLLYKLTILPESVGDTVTVNWSSDNEEVATVSEWGSVVGVSEGTATITATAMNKTAQCKVTVNKLKLRSFSLPETVDVYLDDWAVVQIINPKPSASVIDQLRWSAPEGKPLPKFRDGDWLLYGESLGSYELIASCPTADASTCVVNVKKFPIEELNFMYETYNLDAGATLNLKEILRIQPQAVADTVTVNWSLSNQDVASIDGNVLTGLAAGVTELTATVMGRSASCKIYVSTPVVTSFDVPASIETYKDMETVIEVTNVQPSYASISGIQWKSSIGVLPQFKNDKWVITPTAGVNFVLTAYTDAVEGKEIEIIVNSTPVKTASFKQDVYDMKEFDAIDLAKEVSVEFKDKAEEVVIDWSSSDESIVKVNAEGVAEGWTVGEATITANVSGVKTSCKVVVSQADIESFTIPDAVSVHVGESVTIDVTNVTPNPRLAGKLKWTAPDGRDLPVYENGYWVLRVTKGGSYTLSAVAGNLPLQECKVNVTATPISEITLSKDYYNLVTGKTLQLSATISPNNATSKEIEWVSSNTSVANVSENGLVTAMREGTANITAKHRKQFDSDVEVISSACEIVVTDTPIITSFTLEGSTTLTNGQTTTLTVKNLKPSEAKAADLTWTVGDKSIISISFNSDKSVATLKGLRPGTTTVRAKSVGGCIVTKEITVNGIQLESFDWNEKDFDMFAVTSTTISLPTNFQPANADYTLEYELPSSGKVTLDPATGKLSLAVGAYGYYTITAKATTPGGSTVKKSLRVFAKSRDIEDYLASDVKTHYGTFGMSKTLKYIADGVDAEIINWQHVKNGGSNYAVTVSSDKKTVYYNYIDKRGYDYAYEQANDNRCIITFDLRVSDSRGTTYEITGGQYTFINTFLGYAYWYDNHGFDVEWNGNGGDNMELWLRKYSYDRNATIAMGSGNIYLQTAALYVDHFISSDVPYVRTYVANKTPTLWSDKNNFYDYFAPEVSEILGIEKTYIRYVRD